MALDQSIVFDGGWRLLNRQVPWRDFMIPNGLVPMALQAVFFGFSSISWSAYISHAALVNAAAAVVVLLFLRRTGLGLLPSVAMSVATAAWFYPPMGTPYMDQHSLFFAGAAVLACWHAASDGRRRWWIVGGVAAAAGILSKQVPAFLFLPLCGLALFMTPPRIAVRGLAISLVCAVFLISLVFGTIIGLGARPADILEFAWSIPAELGRIRAADPAADFLAQLQIVRGVQPLSYWCFVGLLGVTLMAFLQTRAPGDRGAVLEDGATPHATAAGQAGVRSGLTYTAAGLGLLAATVQAFAWTFNSEVLLMGWMPLAVALLLSGFRQLAQAGDLQPRRPRLRLAMAGATVIVPILVLADAAAGYRHVALARRANDITVTAAERAQELPEGPLRATGFRVWKVPPLYVSAADSFEPLLEFFTRTPGNLLIAGDETIVYGLTGRPSVTPFAWFHPGLTFARTAEAHSRLDRMLDTSLKQHAVQWIVLPANSSWMGWHRNTWQSVRERLAATRCVAVGTYQVCEVAAPSRDGGAPYLDAAVDGVDVKYFAYQSR